MRNRSKINSQSPEPRAESVMGTYVRIERTDDPRIAGYRDLTDPELVRSRGLFIAEGRIVVQRIIEDGRWRVQSVLVSEAARNGLQPSLDRIADRVPVYVCAASAFLGITGHDIHRGCLALVERPPERHIPVHLAQVLLGQTDRSVRGVARYLGLDFARSHSTSSTTTRPAATPGRR